jgi:hypothetical protein
MPMTNEVSNGFVRLASNGSNEEIVSWIGASETEQQKNLGSMLIDSDRKLTCRRAAVVTRMAAVVKSKRKKEKRKKQKCSSIEQRITLIQLLCNYNVPKLWNVRPAKFT